MSETKTTTIIPNANPDLFVATMAGDPDGPDPDELYFTPIVAWVIDSEEYRYAGSKGIGDYRYAYPITTSRGYEDGDDYVIINRKYGDWEEPSCGSGKGEESLLVYLRENAEEKRARAVAQWNAEQARKESAESRETRP